MKVELDKVREIIANEIKEALSLNYSIRTLENVLKNLNKLEAEEVDKNIKEALKDAQQEADKFFLYGKEGDPNTKTHKCAKCGKDNAYLVFYSYMEGGLMYPLGSPKTKFCQSEAWLCQDCFQKDQPEPTMWVHWYMNKESHLVKCFIGKEHEGIPLKHIENYEHIKSEVWNG